jgi:tRNA dimethylallyltransferase
MQIYKEFSVLTSRPKKKDENNVKHHLYGFLSVKEHFSVVDWLNLIKKKINHCIIRNKTPIIVGGTGLYFSAITKGISKIPHINNLFRSKVRILHTKIGQKEFYNKLIKIDPISATKISAQDTQRSIRAYEVKVFTKKSLYEWTAVTKSDFLNFDIKKFYINTPREVLLQNIEKRTRQMIKNNCVKEVEKFLKMNIDKSLSSNKIIGIKEIKNYISGIQNLDETIQSIIIKTRQYAKSQNTWSRGHMKSWKKLYSDDLLGLRNKILKEIS